jgi:sugar phosphate isomerase/epimerase
MQRILSTYRYIHQPLTAALLADIAHAEIAAVEVFCAPNHFNYRNEQKVRELADVLGEYHLALHSIHSPTERELAPGRESGVPLSISDSERIRRIDAIDEVKRALEVAERVPFRYLIQHIGHGRDSADPRKLDAAFTSLEILSVFAKARGVAIALENTANEIGSPTSLQHFIADTHLHDMRLCLDTGHAHMEGTVETAFDAMRDRLVTSHIHDNHGEKDEHLLPFTGTIDWDTALGTLAGAPQPVALVLELKAQPDGTPALGQIRGTFDKLEKMLDSKTGRATKP